MFAFFLESIHNVPSNVRARRKAQAALAPTTVAVHALVALPSLTDHYNFQVERAFRYWSTGHFVLPEKKNLCKFLATQWTFATNEIMDSVDKLSKKKWMKILEAAEGYVGAHMPVPSRDATCAQLGLVSGRTTCYEVDSD